MITVTVFQQLLLQTECRKCILILHLMLKLGPREKLNVFFPISNALSESN